MSGIWIANVMSLQWESEYVLDNQIMDSNKCSQHLKAAPQIQTDEPDYD
jgi:hypothetical protein